MLIVVLPEKRKCDDLKYNLLIGSNAMPGIAAGTPDVSSLLPVFSLVLFLACGVFHSFSSHLKLPFFLQNRSALAISGILYQKYSRIEGYISL
jgi:hypothetical protein